jgi:hypothetical protein
MEQNMRPLLSALSRHVRLPRRGRCRPSVEQLESRLVLTASLQPTAVEQLFLERVNDARANPASVGVNVPPVQPFAFDGRMNTLTHSFSCATSGNGLVGPLKARLRAGGPRFLEPHSIVIGNSCGGPGFGSTFPDLNAEVDFVTSNLFQRDQGDITLLSSYPARRARLRDHRLIGLTFNPDTGEGAYLTLAPADQSPIVTGCVFRDANGNGKYDVGEGLSGVTITVNGQQSVQDFNSGGYTIAVKKAGLEQVTASDGGLPGPITQTVQATRGQNVRLNFIVS